MGRPSQGWPAMRVLSFGLFTYYSTGLVKRSIEKKYACRCRVTMTEGLSCFMSIEGDLSANGLELV